LFSNFILIYKFIFSHQWIILDDTIQSNLIESSNFVHEFLNVENLETSDHPNALDKVKMVLSPTQVNDECKRDQRDKIGDEVGVKISLCYLL